MHSLIFLTRIWRDELFAAWTELDSFYSLQSLFWMKLTSVPQRSKQFLANHLMITTNCLKLINFLTIFCHTQAYHWIVGVWIPIIMWFPYRVEEWRDSHSTIHIKISACLLNVNPNSLLNPLFCNVLLLSFVFQDYLQYSLPFFLITFYLFFDGSIAS